MNTIQIVPNGQISFQIPISIIFWCFIIAYVLHILEESVVPEVFVDKVKRLYWEDYSWGKFIGFNTILLALNTVAVLLYEEYQGAWIIFPLALSFERILNGLYHLGESLITKKYSSGLLASVVTWILGYWLIKYALLEDKIKTGYIEIALILGLLLCILMIVPLTTGMLKKMKSKKKEDIGKKG
jgi:hypothetical protein